MQEICLMNVLLEMNISQILNKYNPGIIKFQDLLY